MNRPLPSSWIRLIGRLFVSYGLVAIVSGILFVVCVGIVARPKEAIILALALGAGNQARFILRYIVRNVRLRSLFDAVHHH